MGEIADLHVRNFTAGRWGQSLPVQREHPRTTKAAIRDKSFSVVEVIGGRTNRIVGTKLVVCDNDDANFWVWASNKVTGIAKDVCKVLEAGLTVEEALQRRTALSRRPRKQRAPSCSTSETLANRIDFNDDI